MKPLILSAVSVALSVLVTSEAFGWAQLAVRAGAPSIWSNGQRGYTWSGRRRCL